MKKFKVGVISLLMFTCLLFQAAFAADASQTVKDSPKASWLFVLAAPHGKITVEGGQARLSLSPLRHVMYFSDRPVRKTGGMSTADFLKAWNKGRDSFKADAPNAALIGALNVDKEAKNYHVDDFVILNKPQYDEKTSTLSFAITPMNSKYLIQAEKLSETVLFVDSAVWCPTCG
ncbi:MAG: hypothetical protein K0S08_1915 [Gammaproteobacteria bacterium]|jgi:hypothetical protein|nr:hypothetical protein [Gammaproteobacteria bacterium]